MTKTILLLVLSALAVTGCLYMSPSVAPPVALYEIKHTAFDDLKSPFTADEMIFAREGSDELTLVKFINPGVDVPFYLLSITYKGDSWRFMEGWVMISANGVLFEFEDDDEPIRTVLSGGSVWENVSVSITPETIEAMANSEELRIQCWLEPLTIKPEGVAAIKTFYETLVRQ